MLVLDKAFSRCTLYKTGQYAGGLVGQTSGAQTGHPGSNAILASFIRGSCENSESNLDDEIRSAVYRKELSHYPKG